MTNPATLNTSNNTNNCGKLERERHRERERERDRERQRETERDRECQGFFTAVAIVTFVAFQVYLSLSQPP